MDPENLDAGKCVPPLIDQRQMNRVLGYIEKGKKHDEPLMGGFRIGDKVSPISTSRHSVMRIPWADHQIKGVLRCQNDLLQPSP